MRKYNDVTLVDGTVVDSGSEAWRHECEARAVLAMPNKAARLCYLNGHTDIEGKKHPGVLGRRGAAARDELQALALRVWHARKAVV